MNGVPSRLHLRLAAALAALVALAIGTTGYLANQRLRELEIARLHQELGGQARLVGEMLDGHPLQRSGRAALGAVARRSAEALGGRVTLVARDGAVVADSEVAIDDLDGVENHASRPEVAAALAGQVGTDQRRSRTVGRSYLYVAVPYSGGGAVRVAVDLDHVEANGAALRRALVVPGLIGVLIASAVGLLASARFLRPLGELREVLAGFAAGDLTGRLPWSANDEFGEVAGVIHHMADELRSRIRDLTNEKEQLQAVLQGMVEGVLVVDPAGRVLIANPRLREFFDAWGNVLERPALEVIRRVDIERAIASAATSEDPVLLDLAAGDDGERSLQMAAVRFPKVGVHLGTVAVFHDLTEIRRLERVRSEFVANVSHELKTPLTAIRGFAETLQADGLSPEQRKQYLEVVLRHAGRLTALIDDLLELSRIEGQKEPLARGPVDLDALVATFLRDLAERLASRDLDAALESPGGMVVLADRRAVEQILQNLLDNSIKYTDPGGRIRVRLSHDGGRVRMDVVDTGVGIPRSDRARIFERFYRVDKVRPRDLGGTGLGLAIVKHLVQAIGGEIFVESTEGTGTTFSVRFPAAD